MDRRTKEMYLTACGWIEHNGVWMVPEQTLMSVNLDIAYMIQLQEDKEEAGRSSIG